MQASNDDKKGTKNIYIYNIPFTDKPIVCFCLFYLYSECCAETKNEHPASGVFV